MPTDWTPFIDLVRTRHKFLLTTHVRPDPDGLGSQLGLADALERMGKDVRLVISSNRPPRYDFLDPEKRIKRFELPGDQYKDAEVIVILDTGTWNQLGDFGVFLKSMNVPKIVIDHHLSQDELGATRFLDTTSEATGRLVYDAMSALGQPPSSWAANCLFAALATDTGWFRHANTSAATFALAEKLMQAGANPTILYDMIYEQNTLPRLKLLGLVLFRLSVAENGKVAMSEVRKEDYASTGAIPQDTEDMVNYTRSVAGVEVGLFFLEQPAGGIKVSFRARQHVDVAKVAEKFGGGGHRLAAGATIQGTLDEVKVRVLDAIGEALSRS
ncbi:MAG: bifunctional oligoribonuclease/PAP phosphatase NrnA [Gemmataceae bacterium]|nr:bifunctional oligoribonuclease/PAP phosphatase NrnA [Gemmataceae bacterium]MCI0738386.1 bifunctional oligoribonuclease/PAP phosphatase NrnA [Gemmataceae bacterium]